MKMCLSCLIDMSQLFGNVITHQKSQNSVKKKSQSFEKVTIHQCEKIPDFNIR